MTVTSGGTTTTLTNKSTVSSTSISLGSSVTVTGAASGGTTPYKYALYYKKASSTSYTLARDYSTTTTMKVTPSAATTYNLRARVKDGNGKVANKDFTVKVTPGVLANTSTLSASTTTTDKGVTVNCSATGGTAPYQFAVYYKKATSDSFTTVKAYSTTKVVIVKPATAGIYTIRVKAKDGAGTVLAKDLKLTVTAGSLANTSKVSATSIALGSAVTVTGSATGGTTPYKYALYYKKASSTSYTLARDYSTTATMKVTPSTATTYDLRAKVKDGSGKVVNKDFKVTVTAALKNTSKVSATSITLGQSVTVTGAATGGKSPYKYALYYKKSSSSSYTLARDFSTTTTMKVTPSAATTYNLRAKVKDASGKIVNKDFTVKVASASTTALENKSFLSAASIKLGKTVTVTGKASGGTTPYQYAIFYKKASSDTFTSVQGYKTNRIVEIKPGAATKYVIRVKVKDAKGTLKTKDLTLTVTK